MFDIGWDEMALIAVVSLIVIGPKDLPVVLRQMGRWTRKAREMASEFHRGMDDMVRESELDELKKQVTKATDVNLLRQEVDKAIDPTGEMAKAMELPALDVNAAHEVAPPALAAIPEPTPDEIKPAETPARPPEP
ncbi:Twin-arginine translocation protein TatB [Paramagnetospirillum magnetotacticum MS-1]|uniref:Sec-independent protein translocase protein TatB n=1 Tax=Paramagnetospirillum magnetotacticum MS-1 TaxID=272627 RepID=Q1PA25_PARME|nr:Sec-independent protein translocase protein TatB [Paramagnetospirillum magnetotacticum]ABE68900.1 TatB [Paramagnetospirillum magnetotacticum MS-1]KIL98936.1 Twin-arginine translocation protein TatB [Paramagnetospirillum magnetotacticum MS-1]